MLTVIREWGHKRRLRAMLSDPRATRGIVEVVGPSLHHPDALRPVFGCMHVGAPNIVRLLVCKLTLDGIAIPATHFVQPR
jgi:hypothetical protein